MSSICVIIISTQGRYKFLNYLKLKKKLESAESCFLLDEIFKFSKKLHPMTSFSLPVSDIVLCISGCIVQ